MIELLLSDAGKILGGAIVVLLAYFGARRSGAKAERRKQEKKKWRDYSDTRKRADQAARDADGDMRPVDERLRDSGALRD